MFENHIKVYSSVGQSLWDFVGLFLWDYCPMLQKAFQKVAIKVAAIG